MTHEAAGRRREGRIPSPECEHQHGQRSFSAIQQQGQGGEGLAARSQHIGGTDIATAMLANVDPRGKPCRQKSKRQRTNQVREKDNNETDN